MTREKLMELGSIKIPHPSYSSDLITTYAVLCLIIYVRKSLENENDLKMDLVKFFGQNCQDFYEREILSLPERWRQVIDSNGAYIVEK